MRGSPALVAGLAGAACWCAPAPAPLVPLVARVLAIPRRLDGASGVALTFDDGPHPDGTPATLELLARANVTATFFLVGEQVVRWPELAAAIAAAGHEIAVHGYRHMLLLRRLPSALARDLAEAADAIGEATGQAPAVYRPPYGVFSAAGLALTRRRGWLPLLWSRWGRDWERGATPEAIARRATRALAAGDVLLLHDADHYSSAGSWRHTVAALPLVIEAASSRGLPFVPVTHAT
ncbi:MAG: polysaccharide deacetylase family protein [Gaiellaceae bacterium]